MCRRWVYGMLRHGRDLVLNTWVVRGSVWHRVSFIMVIVLLVGTFLSGCIHVLWVGIWYYMFHWCIWVFWCWQGVRGRCR